MRALPALLAVLACAAVPATASAATVPVAPGESVQAAVDGATHGDTIALGAGSHAGPVLIDKDLTVTGPAATLSGGAPVLRVTGAAVTLDGLAVSGITTSGVLADGGATVTVRDVTVTGSCGADCAPAADPADPADAGILARGATVTVVSTTVTGNRVGVRSAGAPRLDVLDSRLTGNGDGVQVVDAETGVVAAATRGVVHGSTIADGVRGVRVHDGTPADGLEPAPVLRADRIIALSDVGVAANVPVTATDLWWGCNGGPGTAGCTSVDPQVVASPHLVLGLTAGPRTIATGGETADLTADLTRNSTGAATGAAFPDGTAIAFATDRGSVSPASAPTGAGTAGSTLTSGSAPGTATASATLDGQTVTAPVTIAAPAPPTTVTETQTQTVTVTQPPTTVTETQTVTAPPTTVTEPAATPPPTVTPTPTPTPAPPTGAELLAAARKAIDRKVYRLTPSLTPGVGYVDKAARRGTGTITIPDEDVVSLMVIACPEKDCKAGVSAKVERTSKAGRKLKPYALRRATFSLTAGRLRVVAVRLTKAQRQGIRRVRVATMVVTAAVSGPGGERSKRTLRLRLKVRR